MESFSRLLFRPYNFLNLDLNILKCNIENKPNNFKSMPNIYMEMLLAWADMDITHNTDSYQTILYEPIHDNPKLGNTHYTQLTKENMHLGTFGTWRRKIS